jgi:hypothetical protein
MTDASPSTDENEKSPLTPPLSKGGWGGFESYFLSKGGEHVRIRS